MYSSFFCFNSRLGIPVNPYYLFINNDLPILKYCTEFMNNRPSAFGSDILKKHGGSRRVLILGLGFKYGQNVLSNSPSVSLYTFLSQNGWQVQVYDKFFEPTDKRFNFLDSEKFYEGYLNMNFDLVVAVHLQYAEGMEKLKNLIFP